eukprot:CAMPEP_0114354594 /NCGR_PEP_ID=MMETSP0101-20121206/19586_1 /TAXON_ID=38822 ORGANISM="Pteridomonas danica, Strain PT" /NCGR_SAMPLE_ID=MMETSP0101 /ASSEMBLY_ACC=CAM_ASM_000211 /LENGTH=195 /DNA_ID=CAMNT_0001496119 /DNA_START=282 /DNA_END=869 /DNA_ORIENTATION=-
MKIQYPAYFSTESPKEDAEPVEEKVEEKVEELTPEQKLEAAIKEKDELLAQSKDRMMRALADAENARTIAKRDVANAQQYAVTKFAKSLLSVADNLTLAVTAIPQEEVDKKGNESLKTLMEGVNMTKTMLEKAFTEHGLEKYGEKGDSFDPHYHDALFQIPDPTLEEGVVGQIITKGYKLKGRVVRPAQVGTVRK